MTDILTTLIAPDQLRQQHYCGIARTLDLTLVEATRSGLLPEPNTTHMHTTDSAHAPNHLGVIRWRAAHGGQVCLAFTNDSRGAYARLLLTDGEADVNQGEGIIGSWTICWNIIPGRFTATTVTRQWPGGLAEGDSRHLAYDLPSFVIIGFDDQYPFQVDPLDPAMDGLPRLTADIIDRVKHWLTHPAPPIPDVRV